MSDAPPTDGTARSGMIWTDPREMMSTDYHVHPIEHSDASYKPVWHSVRGAIHRPMSDIRIDADTLRSAASDIKQPVDDNKSDGGDNDLRADGGRPRDEIGTVEKAKRFGTRNVGFVVGAVFGLLAGFYGRFTARAAYEVRPNLADVGLIRAWVTNHGHDWLFYNYPTAMTGFSVVLAGVVIGFGWRTL